MNEPLCRALISAGLGEEDVAARLEVDTKTVRRWLEGRVPYRRHRWALAMMLHVSDADLWPQLRGDQGRPAEVLAVYPHRDQVVAGVWLRLLGSATREIGVLAWSGRFLAAMPGLLGVLQARARVGVAVRICLRDPGAPAICGWSGQAGEDSGRSGEALRLFGSLGNGGDIQVRLHRDDLYSFLCFADEQLLVSQHVYGIPPGRCPVLHLERSEESDLFGTYRQSFERGWARARPAGSA